MTRSDRGFVLTKIGVDETGHTKNGVRRGFRMELRD